MIAIGKHVCPNAIKVYLVGIKMQQNKLFVDLEPR